MQHDPSTYEAVALIAFVGGLVCSAAAGLAVRLARHAIGRAAR